MDAGGDDGGDEVTCFLFLFYFCFGFGLGLVRHGNRNCGFGCGAGGWCAWLKADVTIGDDAMERSESNLTRLTCRSGVIQVIIPGTLASRKPPIPKMKNENENSSVIKINEYKKKG
jgi:hypothetical protein